MLTRVKRIASSDSFTAIVTGLLSVWLVYSLIAHWAETPWLQRAVLSLSAFYAGLQSAYAVWRIRTKRADGA